MRRWPPAIDDGTVYPDELLRRLGEVGAWGSHVPQEWRGRSALRHSVDRRDRRGLRRHRLHGVVPEHAGLVRREFEQSEACKAHSATSLSSGRVLGGTGLSNPMKSFFGIEKLKLKGRKVEGGYIVRGALPWVSNLGPDHYLRHHLRARGRGGGTAKGGPGIVMFLADCSDPAITLQPCKPFLAMDGTGTYGVQFRDVFVPDELILAEPAGPFVKKIRAGFILLQTGMGLGLIKDCIQIMDEVEAPLGHVNRYLPQQPTQFRELHAEFEKETMALARDPYNADDSYWRRVVALRLRLGDASVAAAHAAMLHCGARGYLKSHRAQRRLREAYFVAIVTPATKQLRKMLADDER